MVVAVQEISLAKRSGFINSVKLNQIKSGGIMSREIENMNIQSIQNEIWRDVVGYEGLYQISNLGRLKHLATPRKKRNRKV